MSIATKLCRMQIYLKRIPPIKLFDPLVTGLARSRDRLKPLYLHYHSVYGHQTWQVGDLSCGFPIIQSHDL